MIPLVLVARGAAGLLHLLGCGHTRYGGRMARFERRLRKKGGIS